LDRSNIRNNKTRIYQVKNMPSPNYSPWEQASDSMLGTTSSLNNVALGIARIKYMQAMQQQRQALAMGQMAIRQQQANQQGEHYQAMGAAENARANLDLNKVQAANELEAGYRKYYQPDMSQGPTRQAAATMNMADIAGPAARSAALGNEAYRVLMPHNVQENAIAVSPVTGAMLAQGPVQIAPGHMYQLPGSEPVINPEIARSGQAPYKFAPGIGVYNANDASVAIPAPQGLTPQAAAHVAGGTGFDMLDPNVQKYILNTLTNRPGVSQGATQPNMPGKNVGSSAMASSGGGSDLRKDAMDAIARGADANAVKERYKKLTGSEADF
jgi:hypothetical protein